ncbi:MAG: esterase/lipase family protein [Leptolyngbyaceae cyanobacterium]
MVRPTVILPGYLAGARPYQALATTLNHMGVPATVVPLRWYDWVPTIGGRSVAPILQALDHTIRIVQQQHGDSPINLVGHSAGGWVSRIYLGDRDYDIHEHNRFPRCWHGRDRVHTLICLGTPHLSQERWTRRNLDFVNTTYPGAFYDDVRYVCVAGKAVLGSRQWYGPSFAYQSYQLTCGQGACWGDGITPIAAAHLEGGENMTLEGVYHSPKPGQRWYGTEDILSQWTDYLD